MQVLYFHDAGLAVEMACGRRGALGKYVGVTLSGLLGSPAGFRVRHPICLDLRISTFTRTTGPARF